ADVCRREGESADADVQDPGTFTGEGLDDVLLDAGDGLVGEQNVEVACGVGLGPQYRDVRSRVQPAALAVDPVEVRRLQRRRVRAAKACGQLPVRLDVGLVVHVRLERPAVGEVVLVEHQRLRQLLVAGRIGGRRLGGGGLGRGVHHLDVDGEPTGRRHRLAAFGTGVHRYSLGRTRDWSMWG